LLVIIGPPGSWTFHWEQVDALPQRHRRVMSHKPGWLTPKERAMRSTRVSRRLVADWP